MVEKEKMVQVQFIRIFQLHLVEKQLFSLWGQVYGMLTDIMGFK